MSRIRFRTLLVLAQLLTLLVLVVILWPDSKTHLRILDLPYLATGYRAKEYCSCMLVIGRSKEACREDLKVSLPILPKLKISKDKKYVTASLGTGLLGKISRAEFKSKELGCTLVESK